MFVDDKSFIGHKLLYVNDGSLEIAPTIQFLDGQGGMELSVCYFWGGGGENSFSYEFLLCKKFEKCINYLNIISQTYSDWKLLYSEIYFFVLTMLQ